MTAFFREALKDPARVGAIMPSSQQIAGRMAKLANVTQARQVIELGAGTGQITGEILRQMPPGARLLAVERHPVFAEELARRFPRIEVAAECASRLRTIAQSRGFDNVDALISTLPWSQFPDAMQRHLLGDIRQLLRQAGTFVTCVCFGIHWSTRGQAFRRHLGENFGRVQALPVSFKNFPPVFTFVCSNFPTFQTGDPALRQAA